MTQVPVNITLKKGKGWERNQETIQTGMGKRECEKGKPFDEYPN